MDFDDDALEGEAAEGDVHGTTRLKAHAFWDRVAVRLARRIGRVYGDLGVQPGLSQRFVGGA